ncbi:ATP-binding SpoIIE family protein phosphatase [Streptomyces cinereoruber]|uniref:Protein phosphatase n=1 Tax=Streptomyces cinereoruber TaxID=67260 RepID=A0ABX6BPQ7_9ACTN|nr:SpoIIE family protein phosphatase [Streptomyces cinereoruber]MBB4162319.1 serine phosphatase RsbU (regulator of sigma subunit)/anti-sigma regulatory factor (Ser/Thr protein kinase) [Streptomyces cinereoruber]MBY8820109.1 SpoIIE family protein phosphatase [Streptomyces cinereoruber]NIH63422.1 serine phosphatase RsbU (regulator of sigma subunit)/anti-sigma regulatory factor (Ser/Thr protein kinase) [Streptomyces cinereoruber]QEV36075.1 protein phosphatase [Streptomyces cinereoruber]
MVGCTAADAAATSPFAAAVLDDRGIVLRWSKAAADLLDRAAEEVCGRSFAALLADDGARERFAGFLAEGRQRLLHRTGPPVEVNLRALRLEPSGEVLLLLVPTHADDEDRVEEERRLRAHRDRDLLHEAAVRIGGSLDAARTAQDLADVLVPALGDLASVELADGVLDGDEPPETHGGGDLRLRRTAVASATGTWPTHLVQPGQRIPPMVSTGELRDVQHGRAAVFDPAKVRALFEDPSQHLPEHMHTAMWAPLFARGLVLGTVAVWRTEQREPYDEEDADLLTEIVSRAALGVDNARRYTRERRSVLALQQRLLPEPTTDAPAAETAGLYLPTGSGAGIGADWYDVIPLPSFRVALVVGDVAGHGLYATATMGRLRTAVRTLADLELDPTELLTHLDDLVQQFSSRADPVGPFVATCLYAVYNPVARRCALASAGHPPPFLITPGGVAEAVDISPGPPLGVGGLPFETVVVDVEPGSVLALYTDGLVEHRAGDADGGTHWLKERLSSSYAPGRPLEETGRAVLGGLGDEPPRDDVALLLARARAVPEDHTASWDFPADPTIVSTARRVVAEQLVAWGLEDLVFNTELIVSELVTNAVRYAGGPVGLRLIRETSLVCEVTDPSNTQPRLRRARWSDEGGRGLFLVAQLTSRWGSRHGRHGKTIWAEQSLVPEELGLVEFDLADLL